MFLGIALTAASLWVVTQIAKRNKRNQPLTLVFTYTVGGK